MKILEDTDLIFVTGIIMVICAALTPLTNIPFCLSVVLFLLASLFELHKH